VLSEGAVAPRFELPALVDGATGRVALEEHLGDDVVILAFYPADFNPACDEESCDLDELDLFTMQKDVTILGISPDSVYSHRAFAERYDLSVPLLADTDGEVAEQYDIGLVDDIGQRLVERAVAVVDHDGTVTYSWSTDDMTELPRVEELNDALAETGGDDTAFTRYRVGYAHYTEGRRAFTSAMQAFENAEWVMAQRDFQQAREKFEAAAARFDTALRFVDDESLVPVYEGANEKATALWQATDWLTRSASAYSSGSGSEGQELRDDAEIPLSSVREYEEPPNPDGEWPPDVDDLEKAETDDRSILPTEPDVDDAALEVDIDAAVTDEADEPLSRSGGHTVDDEAIAAAETDDGGEAAAASGDDGAVADDDIDDEELAEIQAELAADNPESEPSVEEVTEESTAIVEAPPMAGASDGGSAADKATPGPDADGSGETDADLLTDAGDTDDTDADESATGAPSGTDDTEAGGAETEEGGDADPAESGGTDAGENVAATGGEGSETDVDGRSETAVDDSDGADGGGPKLEFELAEPDPDPIAADDPPIHSTDEAEGSSLERDESEGSEPDE